MLISEIKEGLTGRGNQAIIKVYKMNGGLPVERLGFIHDKLDIKILILFVLRRLPDYVENDVLCDLVMCDDGINYFDYIQCLSELCDTGHVEQSGSRYRITPKGDDNGGTIESSLPFSVRKKAEKLLAPVAQRLLRSSMIKAGHTVSSSGACTVELSMGDGCGEIISLRLLAGGEEQAARIEKNFRERAEEYYDKIIALLDDNK